MQNSNLKFTTVEVQTIADSLGNDYKDGESAFPKEHPKSCCCCTCFAPTVGPNEG